MSADVHSCDETCPCHTGGKPMADFLPAAVTRWEGRQIEAHQRHLEGENQRLRGANERMAAALNSIAKDSTHSLTAMRDIAWKALR